MNGVQWKVNGVFKADAQKVFNEISDIGENYTLQDIVNKARGENTELHKCFEWNDTIAAEKYRCEQAKNIVHLLAVPSGTFGEDHKPLMVRAIVSTFERDNRYQPVTVSVKNEDAYQKLKERALAELEMFRKKYAIIIGLEPIIDKIEEMIRAA